MPRHSKSEIATGNALLAPDAAPAPPPRRPVMELLAFDGARSIGTLLGYATVRTSPGVIISGIGVFLSEKGAWARWPATAQRNRAGEVIRDGNGKTKYVSYLRWETPDLEKRWSAWLIGQVRAKYGDEPFKRRSVR